MALLVKLTVVRKIGLRHDAEQDSAMHDEGAIEQPPIEREGSADDQNRTQLTARLEDARKLRLHGTFEGILKKQILIRVGRNAELRKERERRRIVMRAARKTQCLVGIRFWFRDLDTGHAHRDPRKPMAVDVVEHAKPLHANGFAGGALVASGDLTNAHEIPRVITHPSMADGEARSHRK